MNEPYYVKYQRIVDALLCSSDSSGKYRMSCENCIYECIECIEDERIIEKLGTDEWKTCDVDRIEIDAAQAIAGLTGVHFGKTK